MKILVLGDGLLGRELVRQNGWGYLSRKKDGFNITNLESYDKLGIDKFDVIINCIACTKTYSDNREEHWAVNYESVVNLVDYCSSRNIKVVHISTDYIYSGSLECASEEDVPVHLPTWYGYTKLLGDAYAQLNKRNLVIRTSHKPYPFPYGQAWSDQLTNGDYVNTISSLIASLVLKNASGVYNVGTEIKSWYSLTKDEFNTTPSKIPENVPKNVTMSIKKFIDSTKR